MSIFGLPLYMFQVPSGIDVGDIEYIEGKVLSGDYFQESGDIDALNDTIEFIPAVSKTVFMIKAKIVISDHPTASSASGNSSSQKGLVSAALKLDTVTKDKTTIGEATAAAANTSNQFGGGSGSGYGNLGNGRFDVLGLSLVGDGIKKIEIENILDDGNAFASMSGYVRDT